MFDIFNLWCTYTNLVFLNSAPASSARGAQYLCCKTFSGCHVEPREYLHLQDIGFGQSCCCSAGSKKTFDTNYTQGPYRMFNVSGAIHVGAWGRVWSSNGWKSVSRGCGRLLCTCTPCWHITICWPCLLGRHCCAWTWCPDRAHVHWQPLHGKGPLYTFA